MSKSSLRDIQDIRDLKELFNRDRGIPRLILLFSPTWPVCVHGARWVQTELLVRYPKAEVQVYAIWYNMYPGDDRSKWDRTLIRDSRVTCLWDENKIVGRWLVEHSVVHYTEEILWDAYLLFGPEAEWDAIPAPLIGWGSPVYYRGQKLKDAFMLLR